MHSAWLLWPFVAKGTSQFTWVHISIVHSLRRHGKTHTQRYTVYCTFSFLSLSFECISLYKRTIYFAILCLNTETQSECICRHTTHTQLADIHAH